ncbi:BREX-1 system adenine-specific DNA-methyltransferase PglX [Pseudomonas sp. LB3P31]
MNTSNIKRYAPKARTAFIVAMTKRAALFGIRESSIPSMGIQPLELKGDLALIGDRPFPASIIRPRAALVKKVEQMGFAQAMEQAAYSWFNRLCAIRYMELKGYLDHGRRVLSHPDLPGSFQILDDCLDIELECLDLHRIAELKLDGTKDEDLYRELLLAQCHALHKAMPFLFEAVDDATELLLPDNLTKTDSLIRELVSAIPEEDWQDVEIIGWLYQFYISDKKGEVMGKVVKSEDIPAATQLFTPNWIVQYLVQNSVGRQWLQTYPDSPIRANMPYYIEPAEQTPEVQAQLALLTPDSIDPLRIKVLDPACGSGHILVEAYKALKTIYEERGHRSRDIPQLILEHNLFGLDIDDRAGQLAGFALMMLAREDDRRIFSREVKLNVLSLQESSHIDFSGLWKALNLSSGWQHGQSQGLFESEQADLSSNSADNRYQLLQHTLARFIQAKTFGSLIEVPSEDAEPLAEFLEHLQDLAREGDVMQKPAAVQLIPYVQQAWILAQRYEAVIANPPYMGSKGMCSALQGFVKKQYPKENSDLFACFIKRCLELTQKGGICSLVTLQNWMFNSSYSEVRLDLLKLNSIQSLIQIGFNSFPSMNSKVALAAAFVVLKNPSSQFIAKYFNCNDAAASADKQKVFVDLLESNNLYMRSSIDFSDLPGSPIAYWASETAREAFRKCKTFEEVAPAKQGLSTSDNEKFVRFWFEVSVKNIKYDKVCLDNKSTYPERWAPYNKGGLVRRWYGNNEFIVDWKNNGEEIKSLAPKSVIRNEKKYFLPSITWSDITIDSAFRLQDSGFIFANSAHSAFCEPGANPYAILGLLNSPAVEYFIGALSQSLHFDVGYYNVLPYPSGHVSEILIDASTELVEIAKNDWDSRETSWNFKKSEILAQGRSSKISSACTSIKEETNTLKARNKFLEQQVAKYSYEAYEIQEESQVRLPKSVVGDVNDCLLIERLVSYVIGNVMGRYSLDHEGLVYAHTGNQGFANLVAEGAYKSFPADIDGILPLTDQEWFADDATNRFREFVRTVWGDDHLQENLDFVAESLCLYAIKPLKGKSGGESALDTIRRYLSTQFYKDHLKAYKKRPIYWLFSSGKYKAFECLVYLHRYNEGTLARLRTEYVSKLMAKLAKHAETLEKEVDASTSTAEKKALEKQLDTLHNQQAELATFDEKLRHYADQRISLDLDVGVKVNYGKFGDLLADMKVITGDKSSDS